MFFQESTFVFYQAARLFRQAERRILGKEERRKRVSNSLCPKTRDEGVLVTAQWVPKQDEVIAV